MAMNRNISVIFFLISYVGVAPAQVIDPAKHFQGWPWSNKVVTTWHDLDTDYHVIKQLWYSLEDRASAAGYSGYPAYSETVKLDAGIKTNWTYSSWKYWGDNVTNNSMVDWKPHIQLWIETNLMNQVSPAKYYYPDPTTGATKEGTNYAPISQGMINAMKSTIELICPQYVCASFTNYNSFTNQGAVGKTYCMAGLMVDAGYSNEVTDIVTNGYGVVIGGTWNWKMEGSYLTADGLDQIAACIAQLSKVYRAAVPCSPYRVNEYCMCGPTRWTWGDAPDCKSIFTNDNNGGIVLTTWPFAWLQQSLDTTWAADTTVTNHIDVDLDTGSSFIYQSPASVKATTAYQSDWPSNGWYGQMSLYVTFDADLTLDENTNGYGWCLDAMGARQTYYTNYTSLSASGGGTFLVPGYINTFYLYSEVMMQTGTVSVQQEGYYEGSSFSERWVIEDNSTYSNVTTTWVKTQTNMVSSNMEYEVVASGYFQRHTNAEHTAGPWRDIVSFTNNVSIPTNIFITVETNSATTTQLVTYSFTTNYTATTNEGTWVPSEGYSQPDGYFLPHELDVAVSRSGEVLNNGVWCHALISNIRTSGGNVWKGAGTGTLYIAGAPFGYYSAHYNSTKNRAPYEWGSISNFVWDFEQARMNNVELTTNGYQIVQTFNPASDTEDDANGISMLVCEYLMSDSDNYIPFNEDSTHPRVFWGLKDGFFIFDYTFPSNHF